MTDAEHETTTVWALRTDGWRWIYTDDEHVLDTHDVLEAALFDSRADALAHSSRIQWDEPLTPVEMRYMRRLSIVVPRGVRA